MDNLTVMVLFGTLGAAVVVREVAVRRALAKARRELDEVRGELKRQSELADVGQLVSGLAQELKSPLQGVIGTTEVMLASSSSEELRQIKDDATRAAGIVRNLLAFTETSALTRRWQNLNDIVSRALDASRAKLDAIGVQLHFLSAERLPLVYVDGRQLEKVITTLLLRPVAETLARREDRDALVVVATRHIAVPDERLVVEVDDRTDAPESDEPAWSSDLAACRHVLEAHDGALEVVRRTDGGFRFRLELPVVARSEN